jgi:hypothetical protein
VRFFVVVRFFAVTRFFAGLRRVVVAFRADVVFFLVVLRFLAVVDVRFAVVFFAAVRVRFAAVRLVAPVRRDGVAMSVTWKSDGENRVSPYRWSSSTHKYRYRFIISFA